MRTLDQNAILHCWCREVSEFLSDGGLNISEAMIKEMVKMLLGNTVDVLGTKVAMPTSKYKRADEDLTEKDIEKGMLSMDGLLTKMQAWSATDINLELVSPND